MLGIILTLIAIAVVYYLLAQSSDYFDERGVKCFKSPPIFERLYLNKKHFSEWFEEMYKKFPDRKFIGFFEVTRPIYMLRDLELIKQITVKDFDHFMNHRFIVDENVDKLFGKGLFMMKDQKWKDMRGTMSSVFTGSKIRQMFISLIEIVDNNTKYLKNEITSSVMDVELCDLFSRFVNDITAKCVFAVNVNSVKDRDNEFYKRAVKFFISRSTLFKFFLFSAAPKLMKFFRVTSFDPKLIVFFKGLIFKSIEYREKNNIEIHDVMNLLMQIRKKENIEVDDDINVESGEFTTEKLNAIQKSSKSITKFDDDDLISQSTVFYSAGFDTVSTTLSFIAYLLALNPDCQEKLIREVDDLLQELNGKLPNCENIQNMNYMDMVVSETLRLYNPITATDRHCSKRYVMYDSDGNPVVLNPGDAVIIPLNAIHKDEKYFPNPMKFDPERFSKENRHKIHSVAYSPFGIGPRNCIGSRLALIECKYVIFSLLANFRIEKNHLTVDPITLDPNSASLRIKGGFNVRLRLRNKN